MHFQFDKTFIANDQRSNVECEPYQRIVPSFSNTFIAIYYVQQVEYNIEYF